MDVKDIVKKVLEPPTVDMPQQRGATGYIPQRQGFKTRLASFLFEEDAKTAFNSVRKSVIEPSIKNLFLEAVVGTIERMVRGGPSTTRFVNTTNPGVIRRQVGDVSSYTPYNNVMPLPQQQPAQTSSAAYKYIKMQTRQQAQDVISYINEIIRTNDGKCSISDLYDYLGIPEADYTDNHSGWVDTDGYSIRFESAKGYGDQDGYRVILPPPVLLRKN